MPEGHGYNPPSLALTAAMPAAFVPEPAPRSELRAVSGFLARNWRLIAGAALTMLLAGLLASLVLPPRYSATTSLVVESRPPRAIPEATASADAPGYVDTQILTIQSDLILASVVKELQLQEDPEFSRLPWSPKSWLLGLAQPDEAAPDEVRALREQAAINQLRKRSAVRRLGTSFVVDISVTSNNPGKSARIANAVADTFVEDQRRLTMQITERANPASATRIITPAAAPLQRSGPGTLLMALVAGIGGAVGGAGFAALREVLDRRLRSRRQVEQDTGLVCAAVVPWLKPAVQKGAGQENPLLRQVLDQPSSAFSQAVRAVRSMLEEWKPEGGCLAVGLCGAAAGAGSSVLAYNLALLLAEEGRRVLLINADEMRGRPSRKTEAGSPPSAAHHPGLQIRPLGHEEGRSSPGTRLMTLLRNEAAEHDVVLVDLPNPAESGDARALTGAVDALFVVVQWKRTEAEQVLDLLRCVPQPDRKQIAVVLNKARH
ncbi:Wzz/FepE/Etk N-terminal domain-containing protein [Roseomonas sp. E05]|uniref:Wzz/FepE/Etk N-terminal domain-containing protein n=1 Tax=Roseomonas sp. E05 TaxID=3046310 RepID=UPI0024BB92FC|nr:Wzz/FepE/Etk N-terminal domain-containing protein [Roseomonas sp. E05]MDJ0390010.1 Wzz/FepE/Etk N-terminal domain-containing protein [Roseomonas sp. E05]